MAAEFNDLVTYFESLAESHKDIRHSATQKHFFRFELDEVLTGMCSNLKFPAVILEAYDFNYMEAGADNILKRRSGAFIILDRVKDLKNFSEIHEIWDKCEEIGNDFLIKMRADKESGLYPVIRDFTINESEGIPFPLVSLGQCGVRFTFNITSAVNNEVDNSKWL
jgi:hypothetical protein